MPTSPSPSVALQRPDLAATLEEFDLQANQAGFIGGQIFPITDVGEQAANIGRIPLEQLLETQDTRRTSAGGYREGSFTFDEWFYTTADHGWVEKVDERLKKIYRRFFDAEVVATARARNIVLQNHEIRVTTAATNTSTFTNAAAATAWSTHASADPVADVQARVRAVRSACGIVSNAVVMDYDAFLHCKECASIIDRLKFSGKDDPKDIGAAALAKLFGVQRVVVAGALKNTANKAQSASLASVWPKAIVGVGVVAQTMDVNEPAVGRTFHWGEDGSSIGGTIESWYDEDVRGTKIRVRMETGEKVFYPETWQLITGAVA